MSSGGTGGAAGASGGLMGMLPAMFPNLFNTGSAGAGQPDMTNSSFGSWGSQTSPSGSPAVAPPTGALGTGQGFQGLTQGFQGLNTMRGVDPDVITPADTDSLYNSLSSLLRIG